jgi:formylmethanofuran dehydrogenase subunit E
VCEDCGRRIDEDDVILVDGEYYCRNCVHYCDHCNEYHRESERYVSGYGWVCENCLDNYFHYCESCSEYVTEENLVWIDCEDRYVCEDCCNRYYSYCEDCGNYFPYDEIYVQDDHQLCEDCYNDRMGNEEEIC